jgi:hypothetical protein
MWNEAFMASYKLFFCHSPAGILRIIIVLDDILPVLSPKAHSFGLITV